MLQMCVFFRFEACIIKFLASTTSQGGKYQLSQCVFLCEWLLYNGVARPLAFFIFFLSRMRGGSVCFCTPYLLISCSTLSFLLICEESCPWLRAYRLKIVVWAKMRLCVFFCWFFFTAMPDTVDSLDWK